MSGSFLIAAGRNKSKLVVRMTGIDPSWAPARGEQGGQAPTLEKIRVGMIAHPENFSRGLKTFWQ